MREFFKLWFQGVCAMCALTVVVVAIVYPTRYVYAQYGAPTAIVWAIVEILGLGTIAYVALIA